MKSIFKITAAVLAAGMAATLAGCSGCAGCSSSTNNSALTNSNWFRGTSYKGIQPSFIVGDDPDYTPEIINYDVTFDKGTNSSYSVDYKDGSFSTEFYAVRYDWSDNVIPEAYRSQTQDIEILYYYKNSLSLSVMFTKGGDSTEWFEDSVVNECYFRPAGSNLQPVYSRQEIKSTTPANYQAGSIDKTYTKVDAVYESFYNRACTEATVFTTENGETSSTTYGRLNKVDYTLFDNSSLYIAIRSLKLSENLSQSVNLFSAAVGGFTGYTLSGANTAIDEDELTAITTEMQKNNLFEAENEGDKIPTVAVNINFAGGDLQGTTQTVWYAAVENYDNNVPRATMLKISIPLSYNLGTLNFTLKEIKSTLWDK